MDINKSLIKDKGKCLTPVYISGESYSFVINADTPFTDPNWNLLDLQILKPSGAPVAISFATLTRLFPFGGASPAYHLFCAFSMPYLENGQYQFAIYHFGEEVYKIYSNVILIENDVTDKTAFVDYRNSFDKFNIEYQGDANIRNRFRLPLVQIDLQFPSERKQYRNATDRKLRNVTSYRDMVVKLQAMRFDDEGHEALSAMLEHNDIIIDGYNIEPKEGLTIDTNSIATLRNGSVEVYVTNPDNQYNFFNGFDSFIYTGTANYNPAIVYTP